MRFISSVLFLIAVLCALVAPASAQVVINEIHYHPVEDAHFDANGNPTYSDTGLPANLSTDIHEFVEIYNAGASSVNLAGWQFSSGVTYTFPAGTTIAAGGYKVIAANPARLQTVYGISGVLGPYTGTLNNGGDSLKLKDSGGATIDSVNYSDNFPWAMSADGMGVSDSFANFSYVQYKGRSLQRVSVTASSNDPANWVAARPALGATTFADLPTPGAANIVSRAVPKPVVVAYSYYQSTDEAAIVRAGNQVRVNCTFSATTSLTGVTLEYFVDDINSTIEARPTVAMTESPVGSGQYTALLPGQVDRSVVRFRFIANRGDGVEPVSPRADDPAIVPVADNGTNHAREGWYGYFVTPVRTSNNPIYDCFISTASLATLSTNITQSPKRVTSSAATGLPRKTPYVAASAPQWNGEQPGIFATNGEVRDILVRYHGSRYNRTVARQSYKWKFAGTQPFMGRSEIFETDKSALVKAGYDLYTAAGLPTIDSRFVDLYLNTNGLLTRLEEDDYDKELLARYHQRQQAQNPGSVLEASGDTFKNEGVIQDGNYGEGPYYLGDGSLAINKLPTWTALDEYIWTYAVGGANEWLGHNRFKTMIEGMWAARGDTAASPNPNIANLRAWVGANFDVDATLTYLCIRNWAVPFDDTTQNHFLWQRSNGKWGMLPWDLDNEYGGDGTTGSIYCGEVGNVTNNTRGPNFFKDSIIKAYRSEFNAKMFLLNNTLFDPAVLTSNGLTNLVSFANSRQGNVNSQLAAIDSLAYGTFYRPNKPVNSSPASAGAALPPASLQASAYTHTNPTPSPHTSSKWEIRESTGAYTAPVYVLTSTTNLTSLPIPFDQLTFGHTYFWRVTYFDAQAHPSFASTETSFIFGQAPVTTTLVPLDASTQWKWNATAQFNDTSWAQPAFNDTVAGWASGPGVLGLANATQGDLAALTPPQAVRTAVTLNSRSAFYFRKHFNFPGGPTSATLSFKTICDDGMVVYLNGQEVYRLGMPATAITYATLTSRSVGTYAWEGPFSISTAALLPGDNVIAVEVHQSATNSSDMLMGLELTGTYYASSGSVVLNEICAQNRTIVANGTNFPDYLELFNNTAAPVVLTGWSLSDDPLVPSKYAFPAGTTIPAQGYLLVWADSDTVAPGLHAGFKLNHDGQTVLLLQNGVIADTITFGPQARDLPIGRVPNGTGAWLAVQPSPTAANAAKTLGSPVNLKVNEWLASETHGSDWFELYNNDANPVALAGLWLSNSAAAPKTTQVPALSFIAGKGFAVFAADKSTAGANHCDFKLSGGGDSVVLTNTDGLTLIDSVTFGAQLQDVSQGRIPDGGATVASFPQSGSQGESNWVPGPVVINEALTNSTLPLEDAIELANTGASAVDISGWWLTDDRTALKKYQIPASTTIPAGGFKVFYENQFNPTPGVGNSFALNSTGDEIVLSAVDGTGALTGTRAQVTFGAAADGVSFGRVLTGSPAGATTPEFWPLVAHTFGQDNAASTATFRLGTGLTNAAPKTGPVILNEVMYHPPDLAGPTDNARDEFIELHNITTSPQDVSGWKLRGDADFTFASGTTILPGDYVVVVSFNPATDPTSLAAFRSTYNLTAATAIYGPYAVKLPNDGGNVELAYPGPAVAGVVPYILVDKVTYLDNTPWPAAPDGTGPSLQRNSRTVIGNDVANWSASTPNPGSVNYLEAPILDSDGDGLTDAYEIANGFNRFSAADALLDADGDGQSNLAESLAGTNPRDSASVFTASATRITGGYQVHFTAQSARSYSVLYRDSLTAGSWLKLTDVSAQVGVRALDISDTTAAPQRFYRVVTPSVP